MYWINYVQNRKTGGSNQSDVNAILIKLFTRSHQRQSLYVI